ncbi:hypothetical protein MNBD_GAMMA07-2270 [hydrothermal vent metagenome]|uniref:DUF86 domain-containing protein n=1 Tax=hydrothermal vent metagenome TaxID=652676 RepID=A0A3B0X4M3_9ZZZZ
MTAANSARYLFLLEVCYKEAMLLEGTVKRLFIAPINNEWVEALDNTPELAERVDAFVARFGRLQDTIGDKLIPELRRQMLEVPMAALDNLNRMEKLGLLSSVINWVEARNLRNRLVHEYMNNSEEFASALNRAHQLVALLVETYNQINRYAKSHFEGEVVNWPGTIEQ